MSRASALAKKVDSLLKLYAPPLSTVYKRIITRTGGDSLTGRQGSVTVTDTILSPQPTYARGMRRQVGGPDAEEFATASGTRIAQSYEMTLSKNSMTEADLENPDLLFAFKDSSGNVAVYRLDDYEPIAMNGELVAWLAYVSSQER